MASYLMIHLSIVGIIGRLACADPSDAIGRCKSGMTIGLGAAVTMALAGYLHSNVHRYSVDVPSRSSRDH
ncbi:MAG TPA: hypothetical protein VIF11_15280 [Methylomirabilota bacterium]